MHLGCYYETKEERCPDIAFTMYWEFERQTRERKAKESTKSCGTQAHCDADLCGMREHAREALLRACRHFVSYRPLSDRMMDEADSFDQ